VIKASEIEGEQLNVASVRSAIARKLGVDIGAFAPVDRNVEGIVEIEKIRGRRPQHLI